MEGTRLCYRRDKKRPVSARMELTHLVWRGPGLQLVPVRQPGVHRGPPGRLDVLNRDAEEPG